jgi:hypothetical protein
MLLIIDNRIPNISCLLKNLESTVTPVIIDFWSETFDSLASKIPEQPYTQLGILQANMNPDTFCLFDSFGPSVLKDVETLDPLLDSWTSFHLFIELCVSRLEVQEIVLRGYDPKDWNYISRQWNILISMDLDSRIYKTWNVESNVSPLGKRVPPQRTIMYRLLHN